MRVLFPVLGIALVSAVALFAGPEAPRAAAATQFAIPTNPERNAYFGDLHLHTALSFDAYAWMGARVYPEEAYRFARGETIDYLGKPARRERPLDFLAVTDHSENLGVFNQLEDPNSELSQTEAGKMMRDGGRDAFFKAMGLLGKGASVGSNAPEVAASAWQREIAAANAAYQPGRFTTFIAYEWSSNPGNQNLHRNVIFAGNNPPKPFTRFDSDKPEDLWAWLERQRGEGHDALAIPHNGNVSNGLMWDIATRNGAPLDAAWSKLRQTNEPLAEIAQNKGTSETHPLLSPNDEFADFELYEWLLAGEAIKSKPSGSFWREALGRGLAIEAQTGVNAFKYGAVGAGDLHSGLSVSTEAEYGSVGRAQLGGGKLTREDVAKALASAENKAKGPTDVTVSSAGLTGVWAEANTREAIFAALRRRETFATSGTRIKVRLFAGNYSQGLLRQRDWVRTAYAKGVPMGSDWRGAGAPLFAVQALKDPNGAPLDRVQIVKVWWVEGKVQERVFDLAWAGDRRIDPATGKLTPLANGVDLKTGAVSSRIGAPLLSALWRDPTYRKGQRAVYYARVIEAHSPRWSTLRALEYGLPLPVDTPATIQERAWTSPIWVN